MPDSVSDNFWNTSPLKFGVRATKMKSIGIILGLVLILGCTTLTSKEVNAASRQASDFIQTRHTDWQILESSLRADEAKRHVFAVFYNGPNRTAIPTSYTLVAVDKLTGTCEELDTSPTSPYWIHDRK